MFLLLLLMCFHRFIMGKEKSESRPLFLSDYRYFDKSFTVMFLEHMNLVQTAESD